MIGRFKFIDDFYWFSYADLLASPHGLLPRHQDVPILLSRYSNIAAMTSFRNTNSHRKLGTGHEWMPGTVALLLRQLAQGMKRRAIKGREL